MSEKTTDLTPQEDALEHIAARRDKPFLEERFIDSLKRRGVFTCENIKPSAFVVEYRGKIFSQGPISEKNQNTLKGFILKYPWKGEQWCLDSSDEDKSLGRLVKYNHGNPNCQMKMVVYEGKPHLCLFALREINPGEEITYNCRDSSKPPRFEDLQSGLSFSRADCNLSSSTPKRKRKMKTAGESYCDESCSDTEKPRKSRKSRQDSLQVTELDSSQEITEKYVQRLEKEFPRKRNSNKKPGPKHRKAPSTKRVLGRNYCYVCGKGMTKIARHLKRHANEEPDIAKAFSLPKQSAERKKLLNIFRKKGNYRHSEEVLKTDIEVSEGKEQTGSNMVTRKRDQYCSYCKGLFKSADLLRHVTICDKKPSESEKVAPEVHPDVMKILSSLSPDEIQSVIQNDHLLVQLAKSLTQKFGVNEQDTIRQKLSEMGRFMLKLKKKGILCLGDAIKPENFLHVLSCMKKMVGFNKVNQTYINQGLALRLNNLLKKICKIVLSDGGSSETKKSHAGTFIKSCAVAWSRHVPERATVISPSTVPFTQDVQTFYKYLETLSSSATENLKSAENAQVYTTLCTVTIAQTSILSKSTADVSKMSLTSFQEREDSSQIVSKHFIRITIVSEGGQNVTVLLTSQLVSALTLLISKRITCGVHEDNPYLFAKPDTSPTSHYEAGLCIKLLSGLCHVEYPDHLWLGHHLKHMARIFQILNLENDELDHLAKLLGCDIRSNREYYRSPEAAVELAKIAKLLLAKEKGSLERSEGRSLDEVELEDKLEPDVEQSSSGKDEEQTFEQEALENIRTQEDKPFLLMLIDSVKGRGVFTQKRIKPSSFVVEFRGKICRLEDTPEEGCEDTLNGFVFDFSWNGAKWRLDASAEDGSLGRLVNDDHINPNCKVKKIDYEGKPHLCLFAQRKISVGDEITFNYGNSSYPWRSNETGEDENMPEAAVSSSMDRRVDDTEEFSSYSQSSGDEYVCDEEPDSDDSFSESESQQTDSDSDELETPTCTKQNFCYVCGLSMKKMSRHLFTHRKEEPEIAKAFSLRKRSKERKKSLMKLFFRGNQKHNEEVLKTQKGCLKARRISSDPSFLEKSAACIYCKMLFVRKHLWKHQRTCPLKVSAPPAGSRTQIMSLVSTGLTYPQCMSSEVRDILETLTVETGSSAFKDTYIQQLAQCFDYLLMGKSKETEIKRRLKLMGSLLSALNEKSILTFGDALKPQNFDSVVEAIKNLIYFENDKRLCKTRFSLVITSVRKMADIKYAMAVNEGVDVEMMKEAEEFVKLFVKTWHINVPLQLKVPCPSTLAFIQDVQNLYKHLHDILTSAIKSMTMYASMPVYKALLKIILAYVMILNRNVEDVSDVTLQSFLERNESRPQELSNETRPQKNSDETRPQENSNGTRPQENSDEISPLKPSNETEQRESSDETRAQEHSNETGLWEISDETELQESSNPNRSVEEFLSKFIVKISVANQNGKNKVLVLNADLLAAITLLVEKRKTCGVPENHPFLFARPGASSSAVLKPWSTVFGFLKFSQVKDVVNIKSPYFRKHTATIFQILSFSNEDFCQLAKLLGRDIRTENAFYHKPEAAPDIARILVLLSAAETGYLELFDGKSLEDIDVPGVFPHKII